MPRAAWLLQTSLALGARETMPLPSSAPTLLAPVKGYYTVRCFWPLCRLPPTFLLHHTLRASIYYVTPVPPCYVKTSTAYMHFLPCSAFATGGGASVPVPAGGSCLPISSVACFSVLSVGRRWEEANAGAPSTWLLLNRALPATSRRARRRRLTFSGHSLSLHADMICSSASWLSGRLMTCSRWRSRGIPITSRYFFAVPAILWRRYLKKKRDGLPSAITNIIWNS